MMNLQSYFQAVTLLLPVFSATTGLLLTLLSWSDSITHTERRLKLMVASFFASSMGVWTSIFAYNFFPSFFIHMNIVLMLVLNLVPILLYRIICILTEGKSGCRFTAWHYVMPATLCGVLLIWSATVPMEVKLLFVVPGGDEVVRPGYELFHWAFYSMPVWRGLFGSLYFVLTVCVLRRYYRQAVLPESMVRQPAGWIVFLMILTVVTLIASVMTAIVPRGRFSESVLAVITSIAVSCQHLLLIYHVIRRKYLLYAVAPQVAPPKVNEETKSLRREHHGVDLTRKAFEEYFRRERPWLDRYFKITDLVEVFDLNRSVLSAFINTTYGVNFNRYLNRHRLKELERLRALPENRGRRPAELIEDAGFTNGKHYLRALRAEQEGGERNEA